MCAISRNFPEYHDYGTKYRVYQEATAINTSLNSLLTGTKKYGVFDRQTRRTFFFAPC